MAIDTLRASAERKIHNDGGRAGCRIRPEALDVAYAIDASSHLDLVGVEDSRQFLSFARWRSPRSMTNTSSSRFPTRTK
ncbi:hypothetical protein [Arthrobacter sp. B2a2-09]|uniref:hypothetical protein n=1 Tax=Arthrobacter sp. B2a2-09 TaxID=2952822 RepID=UPI0022CDA836|nr:hypothetical protein [Arthrobacter sp. B2a2-09]MCZ9883198.1 hypothetical protein [Arthrobacter sp. B2a2-09]